MSDPFAGTSFAVSDDPFAGSSFALNEEPAPTPEPEAERQTMRDLGLSALSGAVRVPESVVGLGDIALNPFREKFNEITGAGVETLTKNAADAGIDFKRTREILADNKSEGSKQAREQINQAFDEGMLAGLGELASNPASIFEGVVESLPMMVGSVGVVRMGAARIFANAERAAIAGGATSEAARQAASQALQQAAPRLQALAAAAEGGQIAGGAAAEYAADGEFSNREAAGSGAQGLASGAITIALNRLGARVGLDDVEAAMATGGKGSLAGRATLGAVREGPLEEGLQSTSETAIGNITDGNPIGEGLGQAYVEGSVTGAPLGAAFGAVSGRRAEELEEAQLDEDLARMEAEAEAEMAQVEAARLEQQAASARADEADQAASQAAYEVEQQGGDALDAQIAAANKYNEVEARQRAERFEAEGEIDLPGPAIPVPEQTLTGADLGVEVPQIDSAVPQNATDVPRGTISAQSIPLTGLDAQIQDLEATGRTDNATRLRNAQRVMRASENIEDPEQAARFRQRAESTITELTGPPAQPPALTSIEGDFQQAEAIQGAEPATEAPVTIEGEVEVPRLERGAIEIGRTPEQQAVSDLARENDQIAREGVIERGESPRAQAPVVEESEAITDSDFPSPSLESAFTIGDVNSRGSLPVINDLVENADAVADSRGLELEVTRMSPATYIERALEMRAAAEETTVEFERSKRASNQEKIDSIAADIQRGIQFAAPSLDFSVGGFSQDGIHRAMAAQQLGIKSLPIPIVRDADNMFEPVGITDEARAKADEASAIKDIGDRTVAEVVEEAESGDLFEINVPVQDQVRQMSKRLSVMDSLLKCVRS